MSATKGGRGVLKMLTIPDKGGRGVMQMQIIADKRGDRGPANADN